MVILNILQIRGNALASVPLPNFSQAALKFPFQNGTLIVYTKTGMVARLNFRETTNYPSISCPCVEISFEKFHLPGCDNAWTKRTTDIFPLCLADGSGGHNHPCVPRVVLIYAAFRWALMLRLLKKRHEENFMQSVGEALWLLDLAGLDLPFSPSRLANYNEDLMKWWLTMHVGIGQLGSLGVDTSRLRGDFHVEFPSADLLVFLQYCASCQPYWGGAFVRYSTGEFLPIAAMNEYQLTIFFYWT